MLLCCLRRNVDWPLVINTSSSLSPVKNKHRHLPVTSINNLPLFITATAECIALGSQTIHSKQWSQILAENSLLSPTPPAFDATVRVVSVGWYGIVEFNVPLDTL